jgi:hypothetical protein
MKTVSSLGTTGKSVSHFESTADPKTFVVPDDTPAEPGNAGFDLKSMQPGVPVEFSAEEFKAFRESLQQQKKEQKQEQAKVPPGARARLLDLLDIEKKTTEVTIGAHVFTLRTLKSGEVRAVARACAALEYMTDVMFETRVQTLARSLIKVDGVDFELFTGISEFNLKLDFFNELGEGPITKLYDAYSKMMTEVEIKDEKDGAEVVEQVKK